jgi:uncharacterized repeat protein (TIGR01451 family)
MLLSRIVVASSLAYGICANAQLPEVDVALPAQETNTTKAVLVELSGKAASRVYGDTLNREKPRNTIVIARSAAATAARSQVTANRREQSNFQSALNRSGIQVNEIYRATKAVNGIAYNVSESDIAALRALPGVKSVTVIEPETPSMATTVPFLGVPAVWSGSFPLGLTGTGIRVGIIDTGVDYQHAMFGGTGLLADYQANPRTTNAVGPTTFFPTARVVGGFDFAGDAYNGNNAPAPDPNPMDCNGHGTHVASTAAGGGVKADNTPYTGPYDATTDFSATNLKIGPGVAPNAQIYALRVFGCTGSTTLTVAAIEWALDPNNDEDLSDHLDVINMSLGSNFGSLSNPTSVAADNAAQMGMIVVASAGNAGDTYTISGAPGSGQRVIATAATADSGVPGASLTINAPASIAGSYAASAATPALTTAPPSGSGNVVLVNDGSTALAGGTINDGCQTPFANAAAVIGNIALIDRGACGFADKVANAKANGAIGVIIANNAAGTIPPGIGGSLDAPVDIPVIGVTQATGTAIKARLAALEAVNVTFVPVDISDTLASFSSRGPRGVGGFTGAKPDLAAPGVAITAAQTGITCTAGACQRADATGYVAGNRPLTLQGTSMAAPHAAGMMALLKERYPDRSSEEMKAIAMNTSLHDVYISAGNVNRVGVDRAGAGRIDVQKAVEATVAAFNADEVGAVNLAFFGEVIGTQTQTKRLRVVNYGTSAQSFTLAIDTVVDAPGMSFSLPGGTSVTVPAGGSVFVDVQVDATASQMKHTRDQSADATQTAANGGVAATFGAQPRHYLTNENGFVTFSQGASTVLRVPIYAALRPASDMSAPSTLVTGGAPTGSTTVALSGTGVCTGTLSGPSCTGAFPLPDDTSRVSAFELQAVGPKKSDLPGYANIRHVGVAFDAATNRYLFAISTWGDWASPTDVSFNVSVDNNNDSTYDRVIFNTNTGTFSTLFGTTASAQDVFINAVFTPPSSVAYGGPAAFVNGVSGGDVNTSLFGSNVVFLAATAAQLGIAPGGAPFRYKVESCPGFNPLCAIKIDAVAGPLNWNAAAQGLDYAGTTVAPDLNGATIPVTWNTANMTTNGSLGGLLLHHHNASGKRAEVFALEGASSADLAVSQIVTGTLAVGQSVNVAITASNVAGSNATGVTVNNLLPVGMTHTSNDSGGSYNSATGVWTIGALATGASATLNITATIDGTGTIIVQSQVFGTLVDTEPGNDIASNTFNVAATPTLTGAVAATTASPALAGSSANFDVTVNNTGTETVFGVEVTATPPSAPPQTFNITSIAAGGSVVIPVTVTLPLMAGTYQLPVLITAEGAADVSEVGTLAVISPASIGSTKTVSAGPYASGGSVTYTITMTNSAATPQLNNPGDELVDVLPSSLTLVSASAPSGSAIADVPSNTVRWNGSIAGNSSVTVTINATINAGTAGATIGNQATVNSDADGNGTNEVSAGTDDPTVGGASDPTNFLVPFAVASFTKTVSAPSRNLNDVVTYTITISNSANVALADNPGDEMVDVLPPGLTLVQATATAGTAAANIATNTVTWNGSLAPSASVTITIEARINSAGTGQNLVNQARLNFDADLNGSNESLLLSDDPGVAGLANATAFASALLVVPTFGAAWAAVLGALLFGFAARRMRRRV